MDLDTIESFLNCLTKGQFESFPVEISNHEDKGRFVLILFNHNSKYNIRLINKDNNHWNFRILVAKKDINPGELIFSEFPLISGPAKTTSTNSDPVCLICLKRVLNEDQSCSNCGYPTCGVECQRKHLELKECKVLAKNKLFDEIEDKSGQKVKRLSLDAILPLRCLLLKEDNEDHWNYFMSFQSHLEVIKINKFK